MLAIIAISSALNFVKSVETDENDDKGIGENISDVEGFVPFDDGWEDDVIMLVGGTMSSLLGIVQLLTCSALIGAAVSVIFGKVMEEAEYALRSSGVTLEDFSFISWMNVMDLLRCFGDVACRLAVDLP